MSTRIDWRQLLTERRVPFIEAGANVRRGELNVTCCWCGSSDPSKHLGISLETGWFSCWRNRREHSGKSPVRLLMKLLHVGHAEALQIAGLDPSYVDPDGFSAMAARLRQESVARDQPQIVEKAAHLVLDRAFRPLAPYGPARRHYNYLDNRWFDPHQLADEYRVEAGTEGEWKDRVIFPYYENNELVTWTGRAIGPAEIRYKDLPLRQRDDYNGPLAVVPAKNTLFNHDAMSYGGRWLLVVEGPIDALKLDCYGKHFGVSAVALSTSSISDEQLARLDQHADKFDHVGIMMDMERNTHIVHSMRMKSQLASIHKSAHVVEVPFGRKDAGELKPHEVESFCEYITTRRV